MINGFYAYKNYAQIDLDAIAANYKLLCADIKKKSPQATPICVVKADAYGHGAPECVRTLLSVGADFFAVSDISEALEVRRVSPAAKILILGYTEPSNAPILIEKNIIQTLHSLSYAGRLEEAIQDSRERGEIDKNEKLSLHIKVDTGMNRLGFSLCADSFDSSVEEILSLSKTECFSLEGLFSHFACADMAEDEMSEEQIELFFRAYNALKERGLVLKTHISNSAGALRFGSCGCDYVRLGIVLYGLSPSGEVRLSGLTPAMQLFSRVSQVHVLKKGQSLSYGATYTAEKDMRVATISIGYADGLIRACSGGSVIIEGQKVKIIGRICMDQCIVELGDIEVYEGDIVTVYDKSGENIESLAKAANTINYELICLLGRRVYRKYKKNVI